MNIEEMLDAVNSFIAGFGNRNDMDINNAIFIAIELQQLNLPLVFKGAGRLGVESPKLYRILRDARANQVNREVFYIGRTFSEFKSSELMLMASYLWNEGKSSLDETEREKAITLLQESFDIPVEKGRNAKPPSVTASG